MNQTRPALAYTDIKSFGYWAAVIGVMVAAIGIFSFFKQISMGVGAVMAVCAVYMLAAAFFHLRMNGKRTVITVSDDGVAYEDGLFVPFENVDKIWAGNPFPSLPGDILNIVLHLKPDAPVKQAGRGWKAIFFLSYAGGNISMIGKKKMITLMTPGLRPVGGPSMDQDEILEDLFERFDDFKNR
jgi:predicted lipoprotein